MKHIYVTRHGQTDWNLIPKVQGVTDIPLNQTGIQQAKELSLEIKNYNINEILCSPLCRALQTANIIAQQNNIPCTVEKRLIEQDFGFFEGFECNTGDTSFLEAKKRFADKYKTGESMLCLGQRVYNLLDELKQSPQDKNILLVTHGGVARMIHSYFFSMTNEEFATYALNNCQVKEYFFN